MFPIDKNVREHILNGDGNILVSASAGTGKTHIFTQKISKDLTENDNYKQFAAITFTRKASKEIISRLGENKKRGFVGTNDHFIFTEIIKPFMYDACGDEFKKELKLDFSDSNQIINFAQGIEKLKNTSLICKYKNKKKNFPFELALHILHNSYAARRFLKSKYYRLYIDEYQDCDSNMHNLFTYIYKELEIPLFIVGDMKQSIYTFRGAYSDGFKELIKNSDFEVHTLRHNFRSNKVIQNFSNILIDDVRDHYDNCSFNNEVIAFKYANYGQATQFIKDWLNENEKCVFLNYAKNSATMWSEELKKIGIPFVFIPTSPLDYSEHESEHIWVARAIANIELKNKYSEFDFMDEIALPDAYNISDLRKLLSALRENKTRFETYLEHCKPIYKYLGYEDDSKKVESEIKVLFQVINDEQYIPTYNQDRYRFTTGTIHSSKGLEFPQVIINAQDYDFGKEEIEFLHYVAVSRPEKRLLIVGNDYSISRYKRHIQDMILKTRALGLDIQEKAVIKYIN